jgi:hypothetical protein
MGMENKLNAKLAKMNYAKAAKKYGVKSKEPGALLDASEAAKVVHTKSQKAVAIKALI